MNLICRVLSGETDAFSELARPHARAVFSAALAVLKNDADAEEVAQEAVFKAFKNLAQFRREAKFSTWLIQICINEARLRRRRDRRHLFESVHEQQINSQGESIPREFPDWRDIPSEVLEQKELRKSLIQALNTLPEKYREVLILRDVQNISISQTAHLLGLSEANVKVRLCRARQKMRKALAPEIVRASAGKVLARGPDANETNVQALGSLYPTDWKFFVSSGQARARSV
jgi:RNA polymerase sigma-70 factor (ECF subfamily)